MLPEYLKNRATQTLLDQLNATGTPYLTHTRLNDKLTIRFSFGGTWTQRHNVERAWKLICR